MKSNKTLSQGNKNKVTEYIVRVSLCFFLAYLTVMLSLEAHFSQSIIVMIIFFFVYKQYISQILDTYSRVILFFSNKALKEKALREISIKSWLIPSILLFITPVLILIRMRYYLTNASFLHGTSDYFLIAEKLPFKFYIPTLISILTLVIIQTYMLSKKSKVKLVDSMIASFLSTIVVFGLMGIMVAIGTFIYTIIGGIFL